MEGRVSQNYRRLTLALGEPAQEILEGLVGFGETIPFDDDEGEAGADANEAEGKLEPNWPSREHNQLDDADRNPRKVNDAADSDEPTAFGFGGVSTQEAEPDLDADGKTGDEQTIDKGDSADNGVCLQEQVEGQGAENEDVAGVFDGLDDARNAPPTELPVTRIGPAPSANAVKGVAQLAADKNPNDEVGGGLEVDHGY